MKSQIILEISTEKKIRIDIHKSLKNHTSIVKDNKRQIYLVKYERLPDWCELCGMMSHLHNEHGDGLHEDSLLVFKEFCTTTSFRGGRRRG